MKNENQLLKAIGVYIIASLLLAACGNRVNRGDIKIGSPAEKPGVVSNLELTGNANNPGEEYVFLGKKETAELAMDLATKSYTEESEAAARAMLSEEIGSFTVSSRASGVYADLLIKANKQVNSLKEDKWVSLKLEEQKHLLVGEGEGFRVELTDNEGLATAEVIRLKDKVKAPFFIEIRKIKASVGSQKFDASRNELDLISVGKNQKRLALSELIQASGEKDGLAVIINTVNIFTLESRFSLTLAAKTSDEKERSLELSGPLTKISGSQKTSDVAIEVLPNNPKISLNASRIVTNANTLVFQIAEKLSDKNADDKKIKRTKTEILLKVNLEK